MAKMLSDGTKEHSTPLINTTINQLERVFTITNSIDKPMQRVNEKRKVPRIRIGIARKSPHGKIKMRIPMRCRIWHIQQSLDVVWHGNVVEFLHPYD